MTKLRKKLLVKKLDYWLYNIVLLTIAYIVNRFFQMLLFILFYNAIQDCFNYRFHAETICQDNPIKAVKLCKLITIVVEIIYMVFCKELNVSIYSNLIVIFIIALLNALLQFYCERSIISKSVLQSYSSLKAILEENNISIEAQSRMIEHYINKKTIKEIALKECVEESTIKQSIRRTKRKLGL